MLGKIVKVTVDRPMGTYHPKHKDIYYTINYGYIEGIMASDGEEQDAYILGVKESSKINVTLPAKKIGNYFPETYSKEQIEEQVQFQEKYFEYEIECAEE